MKKVEGAENPTAYLEDFLKKELTICPCRTN
jgi:hypothetical protein